jgi:hypothetical protein
MAVETQNTKDVTQYRKLRESGVLNVRGRAGGGGIDDSDETGACDAPAAAVGVERSEHIVAKKDGRMVIM